MPEQDDESFLLRWSRRKRAARQAPVDEAAPEGAAQAGAESAATASQDGAPGALSDNVEEAQSAADAQDVPEDLVGVDIEALDYDSDFKRFLDKDVPEALKRRALRQLWRSDPILANVDGLNDYDDDFTDAALAVKVLETVHKVGRGYLDDDEAAQAADDTTAREDDVSSDDAGEDRHADVADAADADAAATVDDAPAAASDQHRAETDAREPSPASKTRDV